MPIATPSPASTPIQYQSPTGSSVARRTPASAPIGMIPVRALAALRRTPRYPARGVLLDTGADLGRHDPRLPRFRGAVRPAAPHRRGRGRRPPRRGLGDRRLGRAGTAAGSSGSRSTATPTRAFDCVLPAYPLLVRGVGWFLLGHDLLAGVIVSAGRLRRRVRPPLEARARRSPRRERRTGPCSTWRSSRPRSSSFAVYSESLYLAAFGRPRSSPRCAVALDVGGARDRPRGADTRLRRDAAPCARGARVARAEPAGGAPPPRARAADHGALAALPRFEVPPAVRVPHRAALRLGPPPVGGGARSAAPGTRSSRAGAASASSSPGRGTTTSRTPITARCTGRGSTSSSSPTRVLLVALGVYAWRALGAAYGIFVLGSLALPFSDPVPNAPLLLDAALRPRGLPGLHRPRPARQRGRGPTRR